MSTTVRRGPRELLAVLRGGPVLLIPFAVAPVAAWQPFALVTGEPMSASLTASVAAVALTLWIATAICLGGMLLINPLGWNATQRSRFAVETLATWAMLALLPPLLAVGIYFMAVHSWKHTQRLGRSPAIVGIRHTAPWWRRVIAVHRVSLGLLLLSWVFVLPWAWWLGGLTPMNLAAASIGFYIISTLPHHLLGERWFASDRKTVE